MVLASSSSRCFCCLKLFKRKTSQRCVDGKTRGIEVRALNTKRKVIKGIASTESEVDMVKTLQPGKAETVNLKARFVDEEGLNNGAHYTLLKSMHVFSVVTSLLVRVTMDNSEWTYLGDFSEDLQRKRFQKTASWLREQILELGPTFIKIGQICSTRTDLLPQEYIDELSQLQDNVPGFSPEEARWLIESELGAPVEILFKEFEDQPLSAASLGQVHRAITHDGQKVVLKVQRPGLKQLFDIDLRNLKVIAEYFQNSKILGGSGRDWILTYNECAKRLYQEIDYINEAKNADRLRRDSRNVKWIQIPIVFWDYTSSKVLTLEYLPGIKINRLDKIDARGYDRSLIASRAIEAYLNQILITGFFHADPHPGNLAVGADEALIYYDFGMMGEVEPSVREKLLATFYAIYEQDADKIVQNMIGLELLRPSKDTSSVKRVVQFFLDSLIATEKEQNRPLSAMREDVLGLVQNQQFWIPSSMTFVMKAFSTLEGIGHTLDTQFSFLKIAKPYAQKLMERRQKLRTRTNVVEDIRIRADEARSQTLSMPYRIQRIEEFVKQLESGDREVSALALQNRKAEEIVARLQMATVYAAFGGALLNVGVVVSSLQGCQGVADGLFLGAGISLFMLVARQRA